MEEYLIGSVYCDEIISSRNKHRNICTVNIIYFERQIYIESRIDCFSMLPSTHLLCSYFQQNQKSRSTQLCSTSLLLNTEWTRIHICELNFHRVVHLTLTARLAQHTDISTFLLFIHASFFFFLFSMLVSF